MIFQWKSTTYRIRTLTHPVSQIVRMLIGVVTVYIVCWAPLLTFNLLQSFGVIDEFLLGTTKHLKTVFSLMAYFNRSVLSCSSLLNF